MTEEKWVSIPMVVESSRIVRLRWWKWLKARAKGQPTQYTLIERVRIMR